MKRAFLAAAVAVMLLATGCTDATWRRQVATYGKIHTITLYSGGKAVGTWQSTGRPASLADQDGWQFVDADSGTLVVVMGTCVVQEK